MAEYCDIVVLEAWAESVIDEQSLQKFLAMCNDTIDTIMDQIHRSSDSDLKSKLFEQFTAVYKLSDDTRKKCEKLIETIEQVGLIGRENIEEYTSANIRVLETSAESIVDERSFQSFLKKCQDLTVKIMHQICQSNNQEVESKLFDLYFDMYKLCEDVKKSSEQLNYAKNDIGQVNAPNELNIVNGVNQANEVNQANDVNGVKEVNEVVGGRIQQDVAVDIPPIVAQPFVEYEDIESAFERRICTGFIKNNGFGDAITFLDGSKKLVKEKIHEALAAIGAIKVHTSLRGEFTTIYETSIKHINTSSIQLFPYTDLDEWYDEVAESITSTLEEFQSRDSGWNLIGVDGLYLCVDKFNPLRGSCALQIPRWIHLKKGTRNVDNTNNECFKYAVLAALYKGKVTINTSYACNYDIYAPRVNWSGVTFPTSINDISKFEKSNSDISVNVFTLKESKSKDGVLKDKIVPLRLTNEPRNRHINLLYIYTDTCQHFCAITNLSKLISRQNSRHHGTIEVCNRCLSIFYKKSKLTDHLINCKKQNDCVRVVMPNNSNKILEFKNYKHREAAPFIVYADFESILKPTCSTSHSKAYAEHVPFSAGFYLNSRLDNNLSKYASYRGTNPAEWLVKQLIGIGREHYHLFEEIIPMDLSDNENKMFEAATLCHICEAKFSMFDIRVKDHCHFTGKFRGAAHQECNLNYKSTKFIPVVFHNLSGYDMHFLIKELAKIKSASLSVLPQTKEKYISVSLKLEGEKCLILRFIDSLKFLNSSLDKLASYLKIDDLKIVRSQYPNLNDHDFKLLTKKGVFPYEYIDHFAKLNERELPEKNKFYSSLYDANISDDEYTHAQKVWHTFRIETLGDYSDLYLKTDVLLLADVFEKFRDTCLKNYTLDPAYYYTLPGYTWDAALKYTKQKLELLTNVDMLMFVERGIRGGLSQCSNRFSTANNRYMGDQYDPSQLLKYLMYWDVNNLYGWAMCEPLPFGGFRWEKNVENFDVHAVPNDSARGYYLEVDLEYPKGLHNLHSDLPFCPEQACPPGKKCKKLLATLRNKIKYVTHIRNLQQALKHGLILKKIHTILSFDQSPWLKPYILKNTQLRIASSNEFEKNLYKLMNNAVFGKTMENVRNYREVKLCTAWDGRYQAEARIAKPNFHSRTIFSENFVAIQLKKQEVKMLKPIYIGMAILDISKTLVYSFHYDYMLPKLGKKCKIMYTDTDSLIYEITDTDAYQLMKDDSYLFDTSAFPDNNQFGLPRLNKKVPGLWSEENGGRVMTHFIGVRSKAYCTKMLDGEEVKKAKGVKRCIVEKHVAYDQYYDVLKKNIKVTCSQNNIRSRLHNVYTIREEKVALSADDDKRCLIHGSTDTLLWGHYRINEDDPQNIIMNADVANEDHQIPHKRRKLGRNDVLDNVDEELFRILAECHDN